MSYVDDVRDGILAACEEANQVIDRVATNGPPMIRDAAEWMVDQAGIPPILDKIAEEQIIRVLTAQLSDFVSFARNAIRDIRILADFLGSPENLRAASTVLGTIGTNAHTLTEEVSKEYLLAANPANWSDSWHYSVAIDKQPDAVALVKEYTTGMSGVLGAMADAIESFYIEVAGVVLGGVTSYVGLVSVVLGVALCFTGAGAIAGLPLAIIGAIEWLLGIAAVALAAFSLFTGTMQTVNSQVGALETLIMDDNGADSWHQPVLG